MAKQHNVICKVCGQSFDIEPLIENVDYVKPCQNRYAHKKCYEDFMSTADNPNKSDTIDAEDVMYRDMTYDFLVKDLLITVDYQKLYSQWKRLRNKGRTSKGIYFAVRYFYTVEKGDKSKAQGGIGIVDYIYNRAAAYYAERERRGEHIVAEIEQQIKEKWAQETITINRRRKKRKTQKKIDLNLIEEME